MVAAYFEAITGMHGLNRTFSISVQYYVEEACGRNGCNDNCMGFDCCGCRFSTDLTFDEAKDRETMIRVVRERLAAHVMKVHPFRHEVKPEDIILLASGF